VGGAKPPVMPCWSLSEYSEGSEDLQWCNGGPQGCGGGQSETQPTGEQKAQFKRAVEIVNKLVEKAA